MYVVTWPFGSVTVFSRLVAVSYVYVVAVVPSARTSRVTRPSASRSHDVAWPFASVSFCRLPHAHQSYVTVRPAGSRVATSRRRASEKYRVERVVLESPQVAGEDVPWSIRSGMTCHPVSRTAASPVSSTQARTSFCVPTS